MGGGLGCGFTSAFKWQLQAMGSDFIKLLHLSLFTKSTDTVCCGFTTIGSVSHSQGETHNSIYEGQIML